MSGMIPRGNVLIETDAQKDHLIVMKGVVVGAVIETNDDVENILMKVLRDTIIQETKMKKNTIVIIVSSVHVFLFVFFYLYG